MEFHGGDSPVKRQSPGWARNCCGDCPFMGLSPGWTQKERNPFMPRTARVYGEWGYMHVYTRGNGKQILFEERTDYIYYLQLLKKYSSETGVAICSFCLMENHVHLIVYDPERKISQLMNRLSSAYSGYFNWKYKHEICHL